MTVQYELTDHGKTLQTIINNLTAWGMDGLIVRKQYKEIPPRVEYSLTNLGKSLSSVFDEMAAWGRENVMTERNS